MLILLKKKKTTKNRTMMYYLPFLSQQICNQGCAFYAQSMGSHVVPILQGILHKRSTSPHHLHLYRKNQHLLTLLGSVFLANYQKMRVLAYTIVCISKIIMTFFFITTLLSFFLDWCELQYKKGI